MDMVATLIDSFHNFYYSVVKIVGATATACIILEVAYIGIMMALGKFTQTNEMIIKTSTSYAPWIIVEGNNKYYARIKVLESVVNAIEERLKK